MPFYHNVNYLAAPRDLNYTETPFGESFFPYPKITYGRVTVKNLKRERDVGSQEMQVLKKHATGYVVNEFYTSKDFPTIADYTSLDGPENWSSNENDVLGNTLGGLLGLNVKINSELTLSQGFSIQTNDMNGKQKKQSVYNEFDSFISGVSYSYNIDENGNLDNKVPTIDSDGAIIKEGTNYKEVGMHYEVINDFNES